MSAARTLPWSWYADPEVLRREQERIFRRTWQYVGHAGRVEKVGDRFGAWAGDVPVLVLRDEDGPRAFLNVCRHRGSRVVSAACGKRSRFPCPYHGWTYDNAGDLRPSDSAEHDLPSSRGSATMS